MANKRIFKVDIHSTEPEQTPGHSTLHANTKTAAQAFYRTLGQSGRLRYVGDGMFGPDVIRLEEIHAGLGKADAFVFLPGGDIGQDLKLMSAFVAVQTGDRNMFTKTMDGKKRQKPVLLVDDDCWKPLLNLIKETPFITNANKESVIIPIEDASPKNIVAGISKALLQEKPVFSKTPLPIKGQPANDMAWASGEEPKLKVCVFCSASRRYYMSNEAGALVQDDEHDLAFQLGAALAKAGYGVVTGAGAVKMMGDVVRGAQSQGGWTAGSTTPTMRKFEYVPENLDAYIDQPDIYKRMKTMIEGSDAFIVAPGGAGSVQEFLALMHYKKRHSELLEGKPVVLLNPPYENGRGYWDALVTYAKERGISDMFQVAPTVEEAEKIVGQKLKPLKKPLSTSWKALAERQKESIQKEI